MAGDEHALSREVKLHWLSPALHQSAWVRTRDLSPETVLRSAATISATSSSKDTLCCQPSFDRALQRIPLAFEHNQHAGRSAFLWASVTMRPILRKRRGIVRSAALRRCAFTLLKADRSGGCHAALILRRIRRTSIQSSGQPAFTDRAAPLSDLAIRTTVDCAKTRRN